MKKKDREKLVLVYKILAAVLALAMLFGVIFGSVDFFGIGFSAFS